MDAVLFDLDDTLCAYRRPGREVLAGAFEVVGTEPCFAIEDYYAAFGTYATRGDPIDVQREACFEALAADGGEDPQVGRAVARAFADERDHRDVAFLDGARQALDALAVDHRLGLVTNGGPGMQGQKLDALGIRDAFEVLVHGGHDAAAKPSAEPFHRALDALDVAPDAAVHVGNSLDADVAGAQGAGLAAVWVRDGTRAAGGPEPDYTVGSPGDLVEPPWRAR